MIATPWSIKFATVAISTYLLPGNYRNRRPSSATVSWITVAVEIPVFVFSFRNPSLLTVFKNGGVPTHLRRRWAKRSTGDTLFTLTNKVNHVSSPNHQILMLLGASVWRWVEVQLFQQIKKMTIIIIECDRFYPTGSRNAACLGLWRYNFFDCILTNSSLQQQQLRVSSFANSSISTEPNVYTMTSNDWHFEASSTSIRSYPNHTFTIYASSAHRWLFQGGDEWHARHAPNNTRSSTVPTTDTHGAFPLFAITAFTSARCRDPNQDFVIQICNPLNTLAKNVICFEQTSSRVFFTSTFQQLFDFEISRNINVFAKFIDPLQLRIDHVFHSEANGRVYSADSQST